MHITAVCPSCQNTYQVEPSLRGRLMRCPNSLCREVFEVREPGPPQPDVAVEPPARAANTAELSPARRPPGPAVPPASVHQSGSVGDVVPILAAEQANEPAPPPEKETSWPPLRGEDLVPIEEEEQPAPVEEPSPVEPPTWHRAPPVRRPPRPASPAAPSPAERRPVPPTETPRRRKKPSSPPVQAPLPELPTVPVGPPPAAPLPERTRDSAKTLPDTSGGSLELPPGSWEAPPVRRPAEVPEPPTPPPAPPMEAAPGARARRRSLWIMTGILVAAIAIVGTAGWIAWTVLHESEERLRAQAQRDYQEGRFSDAANKYRGLAEKYPESAQVPEYQYLAELSDRRADLQGVGSDPRAVLDRVSQFLKKHEKDPRLKEYGRDLGQSVVRLLSDFAAGVAPDGDLSALPVVEHAERLLAEMEKRLPGSISGDERGRLAEGFQAVRTAVARRERQQQLLDRLQALLAAPSAQAVKEAHRLIKQESAHQSGLDKDARVAELLGHLYAAHRDAITYTPAGALEDRPQHPQEVEPSLLVDQLVAGHPTATEERPVVLALARGVLYALAADTGKVLRAMRVGIDTSALPLRLPSTLANPEMFLVLSADAGTLTALDADGGQVWQRRLSAPCLGRPVVIEQRVFVPTYDGLVHEIEVVRGHPLGSYNLGQRLSVGGARQPGTYRLYVPTDDSCVYVLNVDPKWEPARRKCEAVLYTGHPSGSLRSEPILTGASDRGPDGPEGQGYLFLSQTQGLDAVELLAYALPIQDPNARPLEMRPRPLTRGWTWFPPYHDPEKVALVTDAGVLGLFGIRQPRNEDSPLFPGVPDPADPREPGINLDPFLRPEGPARGRAQIAHAMENSFWVLARGKLLRLELVWKPTGPQFVPAADWSPLPLGSPLHASQVVNLPGEPGLFLLLVTQSLGRQNCLATLVDAENGKVRWQRQLGLVCPGDPMPLGPAVLALDQGGGLFRFDPDKYPRRIYEPWQIGGQAVARPLEDAPAARPYLLPGADGMSAYEIAPAGKGANLMVRRYQLGREGQKAQLSEHTLEPRAPLVGAPALSADSMLLPLADGSLLRLNLPLDDSVGVDGPDWRLGRLPVEPQAHVTWLSNEDFLTTDGGRGLTLWRWPRGGDWRALPANKDPRRPTLELPARIVSAPVVFREDAKAEPQVCVADAEGNLSLLRVKGDSVEVVRRWRVDGQVTAGPFVRGQHIGCVVERRRLVWLDPKQDEPAWEYISPGEGIVGQPQVVENLLVVADQSGLFVGLDPATGQPRGPGYTLQANVAPAASPVAFGPGRAFAPLTDGTVLLLSLDRLRPGDPLRGFPAL